jgi:hypothetical protein
MVKSKIKPLKSVMDQGLFLLPAVKRANDNSLR